MLQTELVFLLFCLQNNSLPFNKYAYLTTHNSFAIVGEPSHTGIPRITFNNQEDTVTDQLNVASASSDKILLLFYMSYLTSSNSHHSCNVLQNGVRALMLDTYDFKGDVWLCHSSGGKCNDFTAFVSTYYRICPTHSSPTEGVSVRLQRVTK
jgi:hypothetical protein